MKSSKNSKEEKILKGSEESHKNSELIDALKTLPQEDALKESEAWFAAFGEVWGIKQSNYSDPVEYAQAILSKMEEDQANLRREIATSSATKFLDIIDSFRIPHEYESPLQIQVSFEDACVAIQANVIFMRDIRPSTIKKITAALLINDSCRIVFGDKSELEGKICRPCHIVYVYVAEPNKDDRGFENLGKIAKKELDKTEEGYYGQG